MSTLLTEERDGAIEWTHYDCWFGDDTDINDYNEEEQAEKLLDILQHWDKKFNIGLVFKMTSGMDYCQADEESILTGLICRLGLERVMDLVAFYLLDAGFDVFHGETYMEIFKHEQT